MPSQGSQPLSQSSPLCLPLLKFSYATVSNDNIVPIPWIHLSSKNALFAIFETSPVQLEDGRTEDRQKFKVLKDPEVMEELDLNALSVEANRVLAQAPAVSSANIPIVAVIVKVPMIAIKYPLDNGQIRRFQIRFSKNEDYYDAMKMLARANVPTVEAGTFPSVKPQPAPKAPSVSLVAPDESASQVDGDTGGPRTYVINDGASSISGSRLAPVAPSAMPPPQIFSAFANRGEHRVMGQPSAISPMQTGLRTGPRPAYPKSNISLSTATTLVPGKQEFRSYPVQSSIRDLKGALHQRESIPEAERQHGDFVTAQPSHIAMPRQEVTHDLPRNRQKTPVRPMYQGESNHPDTLRTTRSNTSISQHCQENRHLQEAGQAKPEPPTKTNGKARGKRGAPSNAKKAPASKKPRAAAVSTRKGKPAAKKSPVPTVEELLQQPGYSLLPYESATTSRSMPCAREAVPPHEGSRTNRRSTEIPESEHGAHNCEGASPELGEVVSSRVTRSASRSLACVRPSVITKQARATDIAASKGALPPCTPADQIIGDPATPASPIMQAHATPLETREPRRGRNISQDLPPVTVPAALSDPLLPVAEQCMVHDQNFDLLNADSRLEAWHKLPPPTRLAALRSYFCELILKEEFVDLVKNISSLWEGAILEGRVTRDLVPPAKENATDDEAEQLFNHG
ncbi:hypothetical protein A1O7_09243 [Cladophialophora yegresii CBS 114405]|uniref:Uncharacterized protein n=1 Tax=Cladophialophora yegresii CBS 114405 TaxID=1182544 RepID=W9VE79_9EURO|nr:uncharacterized protein A1O7_09243 [Cladophialophora yegresii CBS 114405]EXJ53907.1 hypothetical protein A1O7_09243 [Cladophialophora yegresii CBS 114405]